MLKDLETIFRHLLAPPRCEACRSPIETSPALCEKCEQSLEPVAVSHCSICALPFAGDALSPHPCADCIRHPPTYQKVWAGFHYEGAMIPLIHRIKFGRGVDGLRILSRRLTEKFEQVLNEFRPDYILPVPLSFRRQFKRGFNQSFLLVRYLQKYSASQIPVLLSVRRKHTPAQARQDRVTRIRLLRNTFRLKVRQNLQGQKILLVDDVMTTGATVETLTGALRGNGAGPVGVFVMARVERKKSV